MKKWSDLEPLLICSKLLTKITIESCIPPPHHNNMPTKNRAQRTHVQWHLQTLQPQLPPSPSLNFLQSTVQPVCRCPGRFLLRRFVFGHFLGGRDVVVILIFSELPEPEPSYWSKYPYPYSSAAETESLLFGVDSVDASFVIPSIFMIKVFSISAICPLILLSTASKSFLSFEYKFWRGRPNLLPVEKVS